MSDSDGSKAAADNTAAMSAASAEGAAASEQATAVKDAFDSTSSGKCPILAFLYRFSSDVANESGFVGSSDSSGGSEADSGDAGGSDGGDF